MIAASLPGTQLHRGLGHEKAGRRGAWSALALMAVCALALAPSLFASASAIDIGGRRELFVDDFLIGRRNGLELLLHRPIPREVVLVRGEPWEGSGSGCETLFRDGDVIRMYYIGANLTNADGTRGPEFTAKYRPAYVCYAESKDGIHWVKPNLGLFDFKGSMQNNVMLVLRDNFMPFKDANPNCPADERYKAVAQVDGALVAYKSADGFRWSRLQEQPIITQGKFDTQNNAFWDPVRKQYWCYIRDFHDGVRDIRVSVSKDFRVWSEPRLLEFPGSPDEPLYTNQVVPYYRAPELFIGFPTRYRERKFSDAAMRALPDPQHRQRRMSLSPRYGTAVTDGLFMTSRDGFIFHRWDEAFLVPGPERRNNWLYGDCFQSLGMLETPADDPTAPPELSLYVGEDQWKGPAPLRRFTIRVDGFVSLHAREKSGEFVTKPLIFSGGQLTLNFATSGYGSIFVELQSEDGTPLPGFSLADSDELFGDTLDRTVTWHEKSEVSGYTGKPIRIHMVLREADLFSLRFKD